MIKGSANNCPGPQPIPLLLLMAALTLASFVCLSRAGSIFDDDWSPPPAPPKAVEPPPAPTTPSADAPTNPPSTPDSTPPVTDPAAAVPAAQLPEASVQRRPIPPKSAQSRSRKLFKDIYTKELADASSQGRIALGRTLMHDAGKMAGVPSDHFVLLLGAYEAGRDAASLGLCIDAADALADSYEVDGLKLKADVLASLAPKKIGSAANAQNCRDALPLLDEMIAAEDYATAAKLASALRPMASSDPSLAVQLQNRAKEAEALRSGSESLSRDLGTLKKSPDDAAANLSAGKFICFLKGDWARGLPLLAKGSDAKLKELAIADLARPSDSKSIEQLGDRWWEFASSQHDSARAKIARHVASLFADALDGATGIRGMLIEKKLNQATAASGSDSRRVNLLALIDPQRDALEGAWTLEHGELVGNNMGSLARVRIPYQPPEEYDFRIDFTRAQGNAMIQMLSHHHHNFKWVLDLNGSVCGFDFIGGRDCTVNETHLEMPGSVRDGVRCTCVVQVRRGSVAAYVNGKLFERCKVDYEQFSIDQVWELGNDCLGIGAANSNVTFHAIELTEISGTGRRSPTIK